MLLALIPIVTLKTVVLASIVNVRVLLNASLYCFLSRLFPVASKKTAAVFYERSVVSFCLKSVMYTVSQKKTRQIRQAVVSTSTD